MVSITLSVSEDFKKDIKDFMWVNWSEIAREETIKKLIFENYIKFGKITEEEWRFCEKIDWHPVDELPLKEEFKKMLENKRKEKGIKFKNMGELRRLIEQ